MKHTSFIFYSTFYDSTKCLKGNRRGKFLCKLLEYMSGGDEPVFTEKEAMEESLFILMQPQIKANIARREGGQLGAEAGKKGGRPPKKCEVPDTVAPNSQQEVQEETDNTPVEPCSESSADDAEPVHPDTSELPYTDLSCNNENPSCNTKGLSDKTPYPHQRGLQYETPNNNNNGNENNNFNEQRHPPGTPGGKPAKETAQPTATIPEHAKRLAQLLYELHRQRNPHFTTSEKHIAQWAKDIEKLNRIDGRSYEDIEKAIRWIKTEGNFWVPNIISGSKLREKYPQVFLQMQQHNSRSPPKGNKQYDCNTTGIQEQMPF